MISPHDLDRLADEMRQRAIDEVAEEDDEPTADQIAERAGRARGESQNDFWLDV